MKNYLLRLLLATFSVASSQNDVQFVNIDGKDLALVLNLKSDKTFSEVFVFQHENLDLKTLNIENKYTLVQNDGRKIKVRSDGKITTFTIDPGYRDDSETVHYGYGLSHRKGKYQLIAKVNPKSLQDITTLNGKLYTGSIICTCDSGGPGSTSCSSSGGVIAGNSNCSVNCGSGYYACCSDSLNECRCKKAP